MTEQGNMDLTHQEKIRFHNAIVNLSNRYEEIGKALRRFAIELCKGECKDITEERAKEILNRLPARDVDEQEAAVEYWLQRFFS